MAYLFGDVFNVFVITCPAGGSIGDAANNLIARPSPFLMSRSNVVVYLDSLMTGWHATIVPEACNYGSPRFSFELIDNSLVCGHAVGLHFPLI
jgi:hypothetical protein